MVNVTVSSNTARKNAIVAVSATVRDVFEQAGINPNGTAVHLDGQIISQYDFDNSLEDLGIEDESTASIICVVKAQSAR